MVDGKPLTGGCTFCSEGGSGDFAQDFSEDIDTQIKAAKELISNKTDAKRFIAYFQSFTNTYGDVIRLKKLYGTVAQRDDIAIISIGTRPDCISQEILDMLIELNSKKTIWIEMGLQTIHERSASHFHRGYTLDVFEKGYHKLKEAGIAVITHVIFGLPGETKKDMLETIRYLANLSPALDGIKIQNLQILKGTSMYNEYLSFMANKANANNVDDFPFHIMSMEEYTDLVAEAIALLPEETVIHRMTGDGPRKLLVEPLWTLDKKRVLNMLTKKTKGILI